ncbi:RNA polymerase sigma factor [Mucilaginibacter sp. SMC90]|uniref:RNA polymerase sigma factor n=1 Tax=Mucilaginibacter sp. SMC90 TaxID=2929803 RepID=UPI001FB28F84|nr:RNA polymerase sigma factor [Mucilaginibacter sp. SMC90]UOE49404.1 RNA polymerase sigma factor [Mucilaginibacter sp. SMC90]
MTPFSKSYNEEDDLTLVKKSFEGSEAALDQLINRHQRFIYNLALKFLGDRDEAADLTQEVLLTLVSKLDKFQGNSSFRTWMYRIVYNQFIDTKRKKVEKSVVSFDVYGDFLDNSYNDQEMMPDEQAENEKAIDWTRNKCLSGTLICLDRQQRMVFILGAIFNLKSNVAAEILDITPENFRKQLQRAKEDLFKFMEDKCGLINAAAPCRCQKKTKEYIRDGIVSPDTVKFYSQFTDSIEAVVESKNREIDYLITHPYLYLFTQQPYEAREDNEEKSRHILTDPAVLELFQLS